MRDGCFEFWQERNENGVGGGGGSSKSAVSCTALSTMVDEQSPFIAQASEASAAFRRDITKRETITGTKLEGPG